MLDAIVQKQCVRCGGPVVVRQRVGIGAYNDCRRCGPQWTPPYSPERLALGRGNYSDRYEGFVSRAPKPEQDAPLLPNLKIEE